MGENQRIRVVTYNIHKCRGMDRRVRPDRIAEVLRTIDADIIAMQEVVSLQGRAPEDDQADYLSRALEMEYRFGENRRFRGGAYGNVVLSRFPIRSFQNYDLSQNGCEERGCLRVDIEAAGGKILHIYNVHLGTAILERNSQARILLSGDILKNQPLSGPRLLLGDFNEWTRGKASRMLHEHFQSADIRLQLGRKRTYPGLLPFLHLDHIYYDHELSLEAAALPRDRSALMASDHLPIVADFQIRPPKDSDV